MACCLHRWEIGFLGETGFKLASINAVTGDVEDLPFVSPKVVAL